MPWEPLFWEALPSPDTMDHRNWNKLSMLGFLLVNDSHLDESGAPDRSGALCEDLLHGEQTIPKAVLFEGIRFEKVCDNIGDGKLPGDNILDEISSLLVPSAEKCALHSPDLNPLAESINEE